MGEEKGMGAPRGVLGCDGDDGRQAPAVSDAVK